MIEKPVNKETEKVKIEGVVTKENSTERQLSEEELKRIFFLSFRFSQGGISLQKELFKYFRNYYGGQNIPEEFVKVLSSHISSYFEGQNSFSHMFIGKGPKDPNRHSECDNFIQTLNSEKAVDFSKKFVLHLILEKDKTFSEGRSRKGMVERVYFSFFINYILKKNEHKQ